MSDEAARPAAMRESRDIEWLLDWALQRQALGKLIGGGASGGGGWQVLGTRVDGGGPSGGGSWVVHADAQVIADALNVMGQDRRTTEAAALVVLHGRTGTQPDWGREGCGRWVLQRRDNGQGKAIKRYDDPKRQRGLLGFEWKWVGHSVETLERIMVEWMAWHAALRELRDMINPKMTKYVATGPRWPAEPWNDPAYVRAMGAVSELEMEEA